MILGFIWTTSGIFCPLKQWPTLDTISVSVPVLMTCAGIYSFAKQGLSMSSKERIKKVLCYLGKGDLKNFANITGKQLCGVSFF